MKSFALTLFLNLSIYVVHAQVINAHYIDSLKNITEQMSNDTSKVKRLAQYSFHVVFTAPDKALSFAQEGLLLARSLNYPKGQILCNSSAGFTSWMLGDYSEAITIFHQSVNEAESIKDTTLILRALDGLVSSYRDQGNYQEALNYARKGLAHSNASNFWKVMMGSVYNAMNKPDSALYYLLPVDTTFNLSFYGYQLLEVGQSYDKKRSVTNAIFFTKKALKSFPGVQISKISHLPISVWPTCLKVKITSTLVFIMRNVDLR